MSFLSDTAQTIPPTPFVGGTCNRHAQVPQAVINAARKWVK